jgi:hypothetical protein
VTRIRAIIEDVLGHRALSIEDAADRHYSPQFRQRINGQWAERAEVLTRLSALRESTTLIQMTVLDELVDGQRYAERHIIKLRTTEGQQVSQEVYVFGQLDADGRLTWVEELSRSLPDNEAANRDPGSTASTAASTDPL